MQVPNLQLNFQCLKDLQGSCDTLRVRFANLFRANGQSHKCLPRDVHMHGMLICLLGLNHLPLLYCLLFALVPFCKCF